jgi:endonuclease III
MLILINIEALAPVMRILKREYDKKMAPIVELVRARTGDPFQVLVATILSARTLDRTTAAACRKLFKVVRSLDDLRRIPRLRLERLIYPVGFYRQKAKLLKRLPDAVAKHFDGVIPATVEELIRLPGVGRKTANLVVAVAFNKPAICVDVHVHRICNRWGLIHTRTPLETETDLRHRLPLKYWKTFNARLVFFGQSVCRGVRPHCDECSIASWCARVGVKRMPARRRRKPRMPAGR